MVYLTIIHDSGGNHGHQLKDSFGGLVIARMFGFKYIHTDHPYLDFFALHDGDQSVKNLPKDIKRIVFNGPFWDGLSYDQAMRMFGDLDSGGDCLVVLRNAVRIHPSQTIKWFASGMIKENVFEKVLQEARDRFLARNPPKAIIPVAVHINRGMDYDPKRFPDHFASAANPRFMFPMKYYRRIVSDLQEAIGKKEIHIYTEQSRSEEIVAEFCGSDVHLHLGSNREERNDEQIYSIFRDFVHSEILVACNSSFSVMASLFRTGPTIYHPHKHLFDMPPERFVATNENGEFVERRITHWFGGSRRIIQK